MTLLPALKAFYEDHGILPTAFRCPSRRVCSAGSADFVEAKMSYVGPRYGKDRMPRLAFVSLDPGKGRPDPHDRMAEAVRRRTLADDLASLPTNRHWYRTHEMAHVLLRPFRRSLVLDDARLYFAHVNTGKCRHTQAHSRQARDTLFGECCRFVPGELRLLRPDVVVTQGKAAKEAVLKGFGGVRHHDKRRVPATRNRYGDYESGIIESGRWRAFWIQTHHPRHAGGFYPQYEACWPLYAEEAHRFCTNE